MRRLLLLGVVTCFLLPEATPRLGHDVSAVMLMLIPIPMLRHGSDPFEP